MVSRLNRLLLLLLTALLFLFVILRYSSVADAIIASILALISAALNLFPIFQGGQQQNIHQHTWFQSPWTVLVLAVSVAIVGYADVYYLSGWFRPTVSISQFLISQAGSTIAVTPDKTTHITVTSENVSVKVEFFAEHTTQDNLTFTWYTCRRGDKPVSIDGSDFQYIPPRDAGTDCIVVAISQGDILLDKGGVFFNIP
jgi:hypothetical protein